MSRPKPCSTKASLAFFFFLSLFEFYMCASGSGTRHSHVSSGWPWSTIALPLRVRSRRIARMRQRPCKWVNQSESSVVAEDAGEDKGSSFDRDAVADADADKDDL